MARSEELLVENVGDETVVYDHRTSVAHALKPLAAAVFMYADGKSTAGEIAELASYRLGTTVTEAQVTDAVGQLHALSLLEAPEVGVGQGGLSRRDALKTFAAAGAGALLVTSVAAPAALASGNPGDGVSCPKQNSGITAANGDYYPQPTSWSHGQPSGISYGGPCTYDTASGGTCKISKAPTSQTQCTNWGGTWQRSGSSHVCKNYTSSKTGLTQSQCTGSSYGGTYTAGTAAGEWQCIPCDGPNWNCCSVVCAPTGIGGKPWGTGGYATACYSGSGYYGKYCYSCPGSEDH